MNKQLFAVHNHALRRERAVQGGEAAILFEGMGKGFEKDRTLAKPCKKRPLLGHVKLQIGFPLFHPHPLSSALSSAPGIAHPTYRVVGPPHSLLGNLNGSEGSPNGRARRRRQPEAFGYLSRATGQRP